jgi:aminocarboxymuconate-semialdehyde decarboxylase
VTPAGWDIHVHLVPARIVEAARQGRFGLALEGDALIVGAQGVKLGAITDPAAILQYIDRRGLAGAAVSVPPALYRYDLAGVAARDWTEWVNAALAEALMAAPGPLRGLALVPVGDAEAAANLAWNRHGDGWAGLVVGSGGPGLYLDDARLVDFWHGCAERGRCVFLHPAESPDARLGDYYLGNLLGNPYETGLAAARLIFSGIMSRFQAVRLVLAHAGGVAPYLIGRWQRGYATRRPGVTPLSEEPVATFRRLWFDSLAHNDRALAFLAEVGDPAHIVLGSDFPFPMGDADQVTASPAWARYALNAQTVLEGMPEPA